MADPVVTTIYGNGVVFDITVVYGPNSEAVFGWVDNNTGQLIGVKIPACRRNALAEALRMPED